MSYDIAARKPTTKSQGAIILDIAKWASWGITNMHDSTDFTFQECMFQNFLYILEHDITFIRKPKLPIEMEISKPKDEDEEQLDILDPDEIV